jgi:hypothetical protein
MRPISKRKFSLEFILIISIYTLALNGKYLENLDFVNQNNQICPFNKKIRFPVG